MSFLISSALNYSFSFKCKCSDLRYREKLADLREFKYSINRLSSIFLIYGYKTVKSKANDWR